MADLKRRIIAEFSAQNKAKGEMTSFRSGLDKTGQAMKRMAKVGAVMATAAAASLTYLVKRQMETIDVIAKLSDRLGIATEDLVGLQHAASISGVSAEALNKSLEMFVRRLGEMTIGSGEAQRGLDMLGLTTADLIRLSPAEAMGIAADRINRLETQAEKAAAAYFLFGRAGAQLVNMFAVGSEGLREFQREAERLNLTFSRFDAAQIEAANDAMTRARASVTGLVRVLTIKLAPRIEELADKFTDNVLANEEMVESVVVGSGRMVEYLSRPIQSLIIMNDLLKLSKEISPGAGRAPPFGGGVPGLGGIPGARPETPLEPGLKPTPGWVARQRGLYERDIKAVMVAIKQLNEAGQRIPEWLKELTGMRMPPPLIDETLAEPLRKADKAAEAWWLAHKEGIEKAAAASVDASLKRIEAEDAAAEEIDEIRNEMWLKEEERAYHAMRAPIIAEATAAAEAAQKMEARTNEFIMTFQSTIASGLERSMRDWENWKEGILNMLEEVYWAAIRMAFIEPLAGGLAKGLTGALGAVLGPGIFATVTPPAEPVFVSPQGGPAYQHGGVATRPHLAMVGEVPEAIVPLSGGRSIPVEMRGENGKRGITVILNDQRSGGAEPLEISQAEEYILSDQRIIEVAIRASQTNGPYRRSIKQIRR